ncbi:MAG: hypothetical protein A2X49_17015 [Lentisphaerae bacterium GWF2_52_8]|nr:MAG: hypothetical protein A2X49_17015 [Lentisphaerae bacterium GWF2_52_8]
MSLQMAELSGLINNKTGNQACRIAARILHKLIWRRISDKAAKGGLKGVRLILSFDCDTPEDAASCNWLTELMRKVGVPPILAVPGQMLLEKRTAYKEAAANGASFINHGFLPHAEKRGNRYWSITFYSEMTEREVADDIKRGKDAVSEICGRQPTGFRTPHFGHFQAKRQLDFLRKALKETGHSYSSSTIPSDAFWHGPMHKKEGIWEFPVSGDYSAPFSILDSWGHISDPSIPVSEDSYFEKLTRPGLELAKMEMPALLNYYMDPAHLGGPERLARTLDRLLEAGVVFSTYDKLISEFESKEELN